MRAVDTNLLARFLVGDHPEQSKRARQVIEEGDVFIPITVFLELEWVLRSAYGFSPQKICHAFRGVCGLPGVTIENALPLVQAITLAEMGMDFADALHLSSTSHCDKFLTFDRKFMRYALREGFAVQEP